MLIYLRNFIYFTSLMIGSIPFLVISYLLNSFSLIGKRLKLSRFIFASFILVYFSFHFFIQPWQSTVEQKISLIAIFLAVLNFYNSRVKVSNRLSRIMIFLMCIYMAFCLMLSYPTIFRFSDHVELPFGLISVYFGVVMVILLALSQGSVTRAFGFIGVILSGSGTAYLGLLTLGIFQLNKRNIFYYAVFIILILTALIYNQSVRGRLSGDWTDVDRLVISYSAILLFIYEFNATDWLVGKGLYYYIPDNYYDLIATFSVPVAEYLEAEGAGFGSGRLFHNEHLRLLLHVGLFGWASFWWLVWNILRSTDLFWPVFIMSFFGSIILITPIFITLLMFLRVEQRNGELSN